MGSWALTAVDADTQALFRYARLPRTIRAAEGVVREDHSDGPARLNMAFLPCDAISAAGGLPGRGHSVNVISISAARSLVTRTS